MCDTASYEAVSAYSCNKSQELTIIPIITLRPYCVLIDSNEHPKGQNIVFEMNDCLTQQSH